MHDSISRPGQPPHCALNTGRRMRKPVFTYGQICVESVLYSSHVRVRAGFGLQIRQIRGAESACSFKYAFCCTGLSP